MRILFLKAAGPSFAQLAAGNYPKQRVSFRGLPISIENPRGTYRRGRDRGGKEWATKMPADYGYIRGTSATGADGDPYDVFVGPDLDATHAYVVETAAPPDFRNRDEEKAMLGFASLAEAHRAFLQAYDNPKFCRRIEALPMDEFKSRVLSANDRGGRVLD